MNVETLPSYQEVIRILEALDANAPVLVCIDGRCGSGKTTIATMLQQRFNCNVIHTDDFYLPMEAREACWMDIPGGNMDFTRLREEILTPLSCGQSYLYRAYRCRSGAYEEPVRQNSDGITILEGSYSLHPALQIESAVRIFVTCSQETRYQRLREREQNRFENFLKYWIPLEEKYFAAYGIPDQNTLIICTDEFHS